MGLVTFGVTSLTVVASRIIDDLGITREQIGFVVSAHVVLAALLSPPAGRVVDLVGGRSSLVGVFVISAAALVVFGVGVVYWVLLVGAAVSAISLAAANPSTNKLVAGHLPPGRRGMVTGIKQSGVQASVFVAGLVMPLGAATIGWRPTLLIAGAVTLAVVIPVLRVVPADHNVAAAAEHASSNASPHSRLALYGALLGFGGSMAFFLPLFAEEAVGYGPSVAGLAASLVGLVSLVSRVVWARVAERRGQVIGVLGLIAVLSVLAGLVLLASIGRPALLWPGALLLGISSSAWNGVVMLAVMRDAGADRAGSASGNVMFWFLMGGGVASPVFGRIVDMTGSYVPVWWVAIATFVAASVAVAAWSRSVAPPDGGDVASQR